MTEKKLFGLLSGNWLHQVRGSIADIQAGLHFVSCFPMHRDDEELTNWVVFPDTLAAFNLCRGWNPLPREWPDANNRTRAFTDTKVGFDNNVHGRVPRRGVSS